MRTAGRIAVATVAVLVAAALLARRTGEPPRRTQPTARPIRVLPPDQVIAGPVVAEHAVGAWTIRIVEDTVGGGDRVAEVRQRGRRLFAVRGADIRLEPVGVDITGDRVPDVMIHVFSGGLHCCTHATILGLGDTLMDYGVVNGADGDVELEDVDSDGVPEIKIGDYRFAYWRDYAFAETPVPEVLLRLRGNRYEPACDLMREDPPSEASLSERATETTRGWSAGDPPVEFWGTAVDLVYQGQATLAFRWLDRWWPRGIGGKGAFLDDLRERLRGSPCWAPPPSPAPVG